MKLATFLSMFFLAASAFAQSSLLFSITGNGNPGVPLCAATVTTSCIKGYTLTDITIPTAPVVITSTWPAASMTYTYVLPPLTASSNRNYSLVTNAADSNGNNEASSAATATVAVPSVPPNSPLGFSVVAQ